MMLYVYRLAGLLLICVAPGLILLGDYSGFALGDIFIIGVLAIGVGVLLLAVSDIIGILSKKQ